MYIVVREVDMQFLKNTWYIAALSEELKPGELFNRTILNEPIVFYRLENGALAALQNRCPHRFAPLSAGKQLGDIIECGYHGLQFDPAGNCVRNPHSDGIIPKACKVPGYPVVERHHAIWIWMGESGALDEALLPDFSDFDEFPDSALILDYIHVAANYELMVDNIMDLSHIDYLHPSALGTNGEMGKNPPEVREDGRLVYCDWWVANKPAMDFLAQNLPDPDGPADSWLEITWYPASNMRLMVGGTPPGRPRKEGILSSNLHLMTPETDTTTHYFHMHGRDFKVHDNEYNEFYRSMLEHAFGNEDKPMLELQQQSMGTTDLFSLKPVMLTSDVGPVRVRRVLKRLLENERTT